MPEPKKRKVNNRMEKIKMAIWIMNRLIDKEPLLYKQLKAVYKRRQ